MTANLIKKKNSPAERPDRLLMPGLKPVTELLLKHPDRIVKVYCHEKQRQKERIQELCLLNSISFIQTDNARLERLAHAHNHDLAHQGVVAELSSLNMMTDAALYDNLEHAPIPLVLALDQVQDPGNLGTLCRTAYALGVAGLLLPRHESAGPGLAAFKASAGALAMLPLAEVSNLARSLDLAEEKGLTIYAAGAPENSGLPQLNAFDHAWQLPAVLVLGNEEKGIRPGVLKRCLYNITIPLQRDFDSLNVAQAGAILLGLCASQIFNHS